MEFDATHYVPILKCKRSEKGALVDLADAVRRRITPLMEIVELKKGADLTRHLKTAFTKLAPAVPQGRPFLLDAREVTRTAPTAAKQVFDAAVAEGLLFVPVTGLSRGASETAAALAHQEHGLCLRLTQDELKAGRLASHIARFMSQHSLVPERVDLIMDMGAVDNMVLPGVEASAEAFLRTVPQATRWRTLSLSGTAFPNSMGIVKSNTHGLVDRLAWVVWRDWVRRAKPAWPRIPTFSDCGIQHPLGVEGYDPRTMPASATIRYLHRDHWLLVKGQSNRREPLAAQFRRLAAQLAPGGSLSSYFAGTGHCDGCAKLVACAGHAPKLGSPGKWRLLGTAHHITSVVEQLAALPSV